MSSCAHFVIYDIGEDADDLESFDQEVDPEIDDFPDYCPHQKIQDLHGNYPSIYGTFKAGLKDGDQPQICLNHALKLLSSVAVCGLLLSHLHADPQLLPHIGNSGRLVTPVNSNSSIVPFGHQIPPSVASPLGHCIDREPTTCAEWFRPNGGFDSTAMCASDLMRSNPICPRSCGTCAVLLAGCETLKAVDIGNDCKAGEDVVGEVCENDDRRGESYCTYIPSKVDGTKATYACGLCQDSLVHISPERQVILAQVKELRDEEISREDERLMKQTHQQVNIHKLGDLLSSS